MKYLARFALAGTSVALLLLAAVKRFNIEQGSRQLRQDGRQLVTPKFAAEHDEDVLNVHVVSHTHDDVGWLKTVEQYYYGRNNTIQRAAVKYILSTVMEALVENPNRTFTYVEQKFFSMWWHEQSDVSKERVRNLIVNDQLSFVNGGWCMHDEAATHYMGMIDQTTLGHSFLKKELGVIPTVGWQLDPFGHSATQASLLTAQLGFDALYFGRIDYQDLELRHETQECEGLWASSPNLNDTIFWGLTGSYSGNYGPPQGFCFDVNCQDEPLVGDDDAQLLERVNEFVNALKLQSDRTKGNHIMLTMGEDFNYEEALVNFANLDLLISSIYRFQASGKIDVPSLFTPRFKRLNIFYSSPEYYTKWKHDETMRWTEKQAFDAGAVVKGKNASLQWSVKNDDFFPYSDCPHCFWTGYFTSRTGFKRLERVGSSFLQAARQIESMHDSQTSAGLGDCHCQDPLFRLDDAMGVSQHHDAVSGTAKQHVTNDYTKRVQGGIDQAARFVVDKLKRLLLNESDVGVYLEDLSFCQFLNETRCDVSTQAIGKDLYIIVYNGLAKRRSTIVSIPIAMGADNRITQVRVHCGLEVGNEGAIKATVLLDNESAVLYFDTGPLPPIGGAVFRVSFFEDGFLGGVFDDAPQTSFARRSLIASGSERDTESSEYKMDVANAILSVQFNSSTGMIEHISNLVYGTSISIQQEWGYYTSFNSARDHSADGSQQNSSAYIFRPSRPTQELVPIRPGKATMVKTTFGMIVEAEFEQPWVKQTTRVFKNQPFIEVEYTIGPIPIGDGEGKEIVTRLCTPIQSDGVFYTDSNGREFLKRTRSSRLTWNLTEYEPVAGNYYPVNAAIYIEDDTSSLSVVVDRSQGGSSLADGCVELMVQRRTLADDARGVGEAMNETVDGMAPYPPYGNAERLGDGIVIKGKHRIMIGKGNEGARRARSEMDDAFSEPFVFVASSPKDSIVPFKHHSFSALQDSLPENVMLITFTLLHGAPSTTFLIRLGHQYAKDESVTLSQPAHVNMKQLLAGYEVIAIREKTLSGNQDFSEMQSRRLHWTKDVTVYDEKYRNRDSFDIELKPMEIRTFEAQVIVV